ncbi:MAG: hypothetical protein AAF311_15645 [Pseudomonadota bacterium]
MAGKHGGARPGAGRRKGHVTAAKRELRDMAKEHAQSALQTLVSIAQSNHEPAAARVSAANAILDRGYGKPPQALEHTGKDGGPLETITRVELVAPDKA